LKLGKVAALHLSEPSIQVFSLASAEHVSKLLNKVIRQINFWVNLTKFGKRLLLFNTQLFWGAKEQKSGLP